MSKTNSKNNIGVIILACFITLCLAVGATAGISRLTDGFTQGIAFYNEDNLIHTLEEYESKPGNNGNGLTWTVNDNDSINVKGKCTSDTDAVFTLGTITVEEADFYTLSGAKDGSKNTFYIKATYTVNGVSKTLYSDFADQMTSDAEIPSGTDITVSIVVKPGVSIENYTFTPTLVAGEKAGNF